MIIILRSILLDFIIDYYCQVLRLQILFEQAHRIRNQGAKQKDLHISGYNACKSFNIEYWKDYSSIMNINLPRKQVINGKNFGKEKFIRFKINRNF
jgi:hypothetical protein